MEKPMDTINSKVCPSVNSIGTNREINMNGYFVVLIFCLLACVSCQTVQNAKDLRTQLFTTDAYDHTVRPIANQSDSIQVNVSYVLSAINGLDEVEEVLKTTGYLYITWVDSELQWTTATYGDLTSTFFPQNDIWRPDIALKNSNSDYKQLGSAQLNVEVSSDGTVEWYPFQVFISTCSIDITYFPFDAQTCDLRFVAWSYGKDEVYLQKAGDGIYLSDYEPNPSWDIIETSASSEDTSGDAVITFTIKLKRKPLYSILSIFFPILMLSILNLFAFVLPCESGEKCGYAVTVFLAFAVFLTIVEATMPVNSTSIAVFSIYIILMTAQSTIITMLALAMVRCSTFDHEVTVVPSWLIKLAQIGKFKPCRKRRMMKNNVNKVDIQDLDEEKKIDLDEKKEKSGKTYTWKQIINGLDALCLVFFTCFTVLVTALCLALSAGLAKTT